MRRSSTEPLSDTPRSHIRTSSNCSSDHLDQIGSRMGLGLEIFLFVRLVLDWCLGVEPDVVGAVRRGVVADGEEEDME